jgi:DNA-binding winged helix-turn-helix (wHTH) protein
LSDELLYAFGPYLLDATRMVLSVEGRALSVPPKALKTLLTLVEHGGAVVSKQALLEAVWPDSFVEEGNLTQNIFLLRRELGRTPAGDDYIQTLSKRGYRLTVPVRTVAPLSRDAVAPAPATSGADVESIPAPSTVASSSGRAWRLSSRARVAWSVAAVAVVVLAGGVEWWREIPSPPTVSGFTRITHDGGIKRVHMEQLGGPDAALFSDGARVYFTEGSSDAPAVTEASAAGSDTDRVAMPIDLPSLVDVSRARSAFLVSSGVDPGASPLWIVPFPTGTPRRLDTITAWDAAWSPDGQRLAYVRGRELFMANGDGSGSKRLASLPGNGWHPRWSPDGTRLRLTIMDIARSTSALWEIAADGRGLRPLLPAWRPPDVLAGERVDVCCGTWSPDGADFVFQVTARGRSDIWWIPGRDGWMRSLFARADEPARVTAGQLSSLAPAFSPDGRTLYVIGQDARGELQRFDRRIGQFVPYLGDLSADFVDFSRDGQWLLYESYPEGTLWRSRPDGSERTQLSFPPVEAMLSRWSPDGRHIAVFGSDDDRQRRHIFLIPARGGPPRPLPSGGGEMQPSWSPDGTSIMYSDFPFFLDRPDHVAVHILHVDSGAIETVPGSEGLFAPQWSPDGTYVAAFGLDHQRILVGDLATHIWSPLTQGWGSVRWSGDSRWVYYLRYGSQPAVMRVRVADRLVEQVADLRGIRMSGRLAGLEFGLTPDGDPIITRDAGTQEIYAMAWRAR